MQVKATEIKLALTAKEIFQKLVLGASGASLFIFPVFFQFTTKWEIIEKNQRKQNIGFIAAKSR